MDNLKPCPFCQAELFQGKNIHRKNVMRHPYNPKCPLSEAHFLDNPAFRENWNNRAEPNEPLTLDELKARTKPVWTPVPNASWIPEGGYYCLCDHGVITPPSGLSFDAGERDWTFLDHKPEGSESK